MVTKHVEFKGKMFPHSQRKYVTCAVAVYFVIAILLLVKPSSLLAEYKTSIYDLPLEEFSQLDVVVVDLGSPFEENQLNVASTVEQISRSDWNSRGARSVTDAISHLPGTLVAPTFNGGHVVAVRGYTSTESFRGINTQLDGVPINLFRVGSALLNLQSIGLGTLKQIEMIRGPGSALYGADAFHGVLSLNTFESKEDTIQADAEIGSDLYRNVALRTSHGLSDSTRLDAALAYNGQPDQDVGFSFTDPMSGSVVSSERENRFDSGMGVIKLSSQLTDKLSSEFGVYAKAQKQGDFPGVGRLVQGATMAANDFSGADSRFLMGKAELNYKLPSNIVATLRSYAWKDNTNARGDRAAPLGDPTSIYTKEYRTGTSFFLKQQENSINTEWALGYEFSRQKIREDSENGTPSFLDGANREINSAVLHAKTEFIEDTLYLVYGGRYDKYSESDNHTAPRAGLIYKPQNDTAIKFLYGNAYRPNDAIERHGTFAIRPASGKPEVIDHFELVFMKQSKNWKFFTNLFRNEWDDALRAGPDLEPGPPTIRRDNIGENRSHGVEAGIEYRSQQAGIKLDLSYVDSEDRTNNQDFVAFPTWIVNSQLSVFDLMPNFNLYLTNRIHLDAKETQTSGFEPAPADLQDYWRTDLMLSWKKPENDYEIYLGALNLFDRENFFPSPVAAEAGTPDENDLTAFIGIRWSN